MDGNAMPEGLPTWNSIPEVEAFLAGLGTVPWFQNIGRPLPEGTNAKRIREWDDWPGPEDSTVGAIYEREQAIHDELFAHDESGTAREFWNHVLGTVLERAGAAIPVDEALDSWHPPNFAQYQAAWTAGLVGLCVLLKTPVPAELQEEWDWFLTGHWPCQWDDLQPDSPWVVL